MDQQAAIVSVIASSMPNADRLRLSSGGGEGMMEQSEPTLLLVSKVSNFDTFQNTFQPTQRCCCV
jgi:hypothetical protein